MSIEPGSESVWGDFLNEEEERGSTIGGDEQARVSYDQQIKTLTKGRPTEGKRSLARAVQNPS